MRMPKTMKGYISFFIDVELRMPHTYVKGFDELPIETQNLIKEFSGAISNYFNEIKDQYKEHLKKGK